MSDSCKIADIPVWWKLLKSESEYDDRNKRYVSELILNSEWKISCTFTTSRTQDSLLTIHRRSGATEVQVTGYFNIYDRYNCCNAQPSFSYLMEPDRKSKLINLETSICEYFQLHGNVVFEKKIQQDTSDEVQVGSAKEQMSQSENSSPSSECFEPLRELSDDFARLLDQKTPSFADLQLKCESLTIPAHKIILSARSPVFSAMFSNEMKEAIDNEVHITDIDAPTLEAMLRYIYTGQTGSLSDVLAGDLLFAADKYQLEGLKKVTCNYLKSNVSVQNVLQLLVLGDNHAQDLKDFAMDFIRDECSEFSSLENTEEWKTLVEERPSLAIEALTLLVRSKDKK
ncbi:speckle-type POZ protein B [Nephila pilipes]|uniref:Speckle-type POZ protein B n=1 Tax=Nephila pilipes TaxID=299642 RepID=A0A8X6PXC5_NEPPI|nr:speckle-type POZ protein B [Nephila pilipes]